MAEISSKNQVICAYKTRTQKGKKAYFEKPPLTTPDFTAWKISAMIET